ncbi:MAG: VanZ family protein [Bacteroidales bacterium]|nr:VanZ family protein [Bacteroidales bacterium]
MLRNLLIISIAWSVIILVLSALPGDSLPHSVIWNFPHFDKIVHMGLYFPLSLFLVAEFDLTQRRTLVTLAPFIAILTVALYGGVLEVAQERLFVHRSADLFDFFADLLGGLLGILSYYLLFRKLLLRISRKN